MARKKSRESALLTISFGTILIAVTSLLLSLGIFAPQPAGAFFTFPPNTVVSLASNRFSLPLQPVTVLFGTLFQGTTGPVLNEPDGGFDLFDLPQTDTIGDFDLSTGQLTNVYSIQDSFCKPGATDKIYELFQSNDITTSVPGVPGGYMVFGEAACSPQYQTGTYCDSTRGMCRCGQFQQFPLPPNTVANQIAIDPPWIAATLSGQGFTNYLHLSPFQNPSFQPVTPNPPSIYHASPSMSTISATNNPRIVWVELLGTITQIFYWDAVSQSAQMVSPQPGISQQAPDISGNTIVWLQNPPFGPSNIWRYDLGLDGLFSTPDDGGASSVTNTFSVSGAPYVEGNIIVWDENSVIMWCDLSLNGNPGGCLANDQKNTIGPGSSSSLSGNLIAYVQGGDIYLYDLSLGSNTLLVTGPSFSFSPKISGQKVIFMDDRYGGTSLFMKNIATAAEIPLALNSENPNNNVFGSQIAGNMFAFIQGANGGTIQLVDLSSC